MDASHTHQSTARRMLVFNGVRSSSCCVSSSDGELYSGIYIDFMGTDSAIFRTMGGSTAMRTDQYNSRWLNGTKYTLTRVSTRCHGGLTQLWPLCHPSLIPLSPESHLTVIGVSFSSQSALIMLWPSFHPSLIWVSLPTQITLILISTPLSPTVIRVSTHSHSLFLILLFQIRRLCTCTWSPTAPRGTTINFISSSERNRWTPDRARNLRHALAVSAWWVWGTSYNPSKMSNLYKIINSPTFSGPYNCTYFWTVGGNQSLWRKPRLTQVKHPKSKHRKRIEPFLFCFIPDHDWLAVSKGVFVCISS